MQNGLNKSFLSGRTLALLIALAVFLCHLPVIGAVGLGDSEAYYWTWSKHLDLSYYDHPPAIAYVIRAGTYIFGVNSFGVRFFPSILTTISLFLIYLTGEAIAGTLAGLASMLATMCMPLFLVGGVAAAPDAPLAFCITLAMYLFVMTGDRYANFSPEPPGSLRRNKSDLRSLSNGNDCANFSPEPPARYPYHLIFVGLFLGLGFASKYSAVMLIPGFIAVSLLRNNRRWWREPYLYLGMILCAIAASPVITWNMERGWASSVYHLSTRQGSAGFSLTNLGKLIGGQLGYFSPFIIFGFGWSLVKAWRGRKTSPLPFELSLIGLPAVLFFYLVILVTPNAEPHWTLAGYLPLCVVLGWAIAEGKESLKSIIGAGRRKAAIISAAVYSMLLFVVAHICILTPAFVLLTPPTYNPKYDITNELYGWDQAGDKIREIYNEHEKNSPMLLGYHYTMCSQVMFSSGGELETRCISPRISQFSFFPGADGTFNGRDAIYVSDNRFKMKPLELYDFKSCAIKDRLSIKRGGRNVREFEIYYCSGYGGMKLP